MNEGLREAMLGRMETLGVNIEALNATADELVRSAILLDGQPVARTLLARARGHRVQVLEMQGKLAALHERYNTRFWAEPRA